jgi:hypothetical protein
MQTKSLLYPIIVGLCIICVVYYITGALGMRSYKQEIPKPNDTHYHTETVVKVKTVYITKLKATIDTVTIDHFEAEVAEADTVLEADSTRIWVKYYGNPFNEFEISADIKEKIITNTLQIKEYIPCPPESFWDKFNMSLSCGVGYGLINQKPDVFLGITIGYKLKNLW